MRSRLLWASLALLATTALLRPGAGLAPSWAQQLTRPTTKPEDRVRIYSDKAIYKRQQKLAEAIGHVKIIQDNTTIYADKVLYNEASKQSFVDDGVKIVQVNKEKEKGRTTTLTAAKMTAFHEERRMILEKDVRMDRDAVNVEPPPDFTESKPVRRERTEKAIQRARTVITSDRMEYFTRSENANLEGNVVMLQKDKQITGNKAFVRGEQDGDLVIVEGNAIVTQINGNWLVRNKIIKPEPEDREQERFLREKLVIQADKITFYRATDDLRAEGNVKITQKVGGKERVATGTEATYSERQQLATLTGDVRIQRENADWLTAERALFYTERETFEAIGDNQEQVISEFTIEDEDNPRPEEPINPPLPEFDLDNHTPGEFLPSWLRSRQNPQRAPAQPARPQASPGPTPRPTPRPSARSTPAPGPTPRPSVPPAPPSATPTPAAGASPTPVPGPVESSFSIDVNE
ncbi:MAG: LptA/OstA family protein [Candidatus Sericytochromatia bacterium]